MPLCCTSFPALREMPIAMQTDKAKEQHYELPTSFFKLVLGKYFKYRYFLYSNGNSTGVQYTLAFERN